MAGSVVVAVSVGSVEELLVVVAQGVDIEQVSFACRFTGKM